MKLIVGSFCALMSLVLISVTIWLSARGAFGAGMVSMIISFALLLISVTILRPGRTRL